MKLVQAVFCGKCGKPMLNELTLENGDEIYTCSNPRCIHALEIAKASRFNYLRSLGITSSYDPFSPHHPQEENIE